MNVHFVWVAFHVIGPYRPHRLCPGSQRKAENRGKDDNSAAPRLSAEERNEHTHGSLSVTVQGTHPW